MKEKGFRKSRDKTIQTPQGRRRKKGQNGRLLKSCIVKVGVRLNEKCFSKLDAAKVRVTNASFFAISDKNVFLFL